MAKTTTSTASPEDKKAKKTGKTTNTKKKQHTTRQAFDRIASAWGSDIATRGVQRKPVAVWSTGIASLDIATTIGGYARSCVVEIFGPNQAGKTALALAAMAQAARFYGRPSLFLDLEAETTSKWMLTHGMDLDKIDHVKMLPPGKKKGFEGIPSGEALIDAVVEMIQEGEYGFIVLDSVASLLPSTLVGKPLEDSKARGLHSGFIGDALKHIVPIMAKTETTMIAMNQIRMNANATFGNPEYTTGGLALAHYKVMSVRVSKSDQESKKADRPGAERKMKIIKNKKGEPFSDAKVFLHRKLGLMIYEDLFLTALRLGVITRTGKKSASEKYRCEAMSADINLDTFADDTSKDPVFMRELWDLTVAKGLQRFEIGHDGDEVEDPEEEEVLDELGDEEDLD